MSPPRTSTPQHILIFNIFIVRSLVECLINRQLTLTNKC